MRDVLTAYDRGKWRMGYREEDHNQIVLPRPFDPHLDHVATISGFRTIYVLRHTNGNYYGREEGTYLLMHRLFKVGGSADIVQRQVFLDPRLRDWRSGAIGESKAPTRA